MPTPDELASEKERLYESSSLRDDLDDEQAEQLLKWGEKQIERIAQEFPDEFEQKCRFFRQLLKGINRFVGQREFNDLQGQRKYLSKVTMYLEPLGYTTQEQDLINRLPEDPKDMAGTLSAMLNMLAPNEESPSDPIAAYNTNSVTEVLPSIEDIMPDQPDQPDEIS